MNGNTPAGVTELRLRQGLSGDIRNVDAGSGGSNAQSSLYALGGPRSEQFTLKIVF
jgi:hypothetical protein